MYSTSIIVIPSENGWVTKTLLFQVNNYGDLLGSFSLRQRAILEKKTGQFYTLIKELAY